jgi:hypothetical protein
MGATVAGTVTIQVVTSMSDNDAWWQGLAVDGVPTGITDAGHHLQLIWDSTTAPNGNHTLAVTAHQVTTGTITGEAAVAVVVNNAGKPTPSPGVPTPAPTIVAGPFVPLSDAVAAARVVRATWEPRPDNNAANHAIPTSVQLGQVANLAFLNADGNRLVHLVTGNFTATTDEILQWASAKWGFNPDITRATAVDESYWHQNGAGDIGNGVSLGILQIKSRDYTGTCPNGWTATSNTSPVLALPACLSHNLTGFAAEYKLMYQRACVTGDIGYLAERVPTAGYAKYVLGPGANNDLWGCVGNWFSGGWQDAGSLSYQAKVKADLAKRTWTQPGF